MSEEVSVIFKLTEPCECGKEGDGLCEVWEDCGGTGEVLTENGKALIKFIQTYIFTEVD